MSFLVALWLTGVRVVLANLFWPLAALLYIVLVWRFVRWYRRREKVWQQEPAGIETFTPEYFELYQTGLWLLQHKETTPYDDL